MWWKFLIVNSGVETIRIVRAKKAIFQGTVQAGFSWNLTLNDMVYTKNKAGVFAKKLTILNWHSKPSLMLYPPLGRKGHKVFMSSLPHVPGKTFRGQLMKQYKEDR